MVLLKSSNYTLQEWWSCYNQVITCYRNDGPVNTQYLHKNDDHVNTQYLHKNDNPVGFQYLHKNNGHVNILYLQHTSILSQERQSCKHPISIFNVTIMTAI